MPKVKQAKQRKQAKRYTVTCIYCETPFGPIQADDEYEAHQEVKAQGWIWLGGTDWSCPEHYETVSWEVLCPDMLPE